MAYNMSFAQNATSLPSLLQGFNTTLSGVPGTFLVFVVYIGLFAAFKTGNDTLNSLIISSFITIIVGALFLWLELVQFWVVLIPVIGMVAGIILLFFQN